MFLTYKLQSFCTSILSFLKKSKRKNSSTETSINVSSDSTISTTSNLDHTNDSNHSHSANQQQYIVGNHLVSAAQLIRANRSAFWIPGFAMASWSPLIPFIKENFALGDGHLGWLLLCLASGAGSAVLIAPLVISRFGCRKAVRSAGLILTICLLSITLMSNLPVLAAVLFLYGLSIEIVSTASNINAVKLEAYLQRPLLSGMYGMISLGNVGGVLLVAAMLQFDWGLPLPVLCSAELLSLGILLYCSQIASRYLLDKHELRKTSYTLSQDAVTQKQAQRTKESSLFQKQHLRQTTNSFNKAQTPSSNTNNLQHAKVQDSKDLNFAVLRQALSHPILLTLGIVCLMVYSTEDSMNDWSGIYLHQTYALPLQSAGLGFLAFAVMMTLSRLIGDRLVVWIGRRKVILYGALTTALGLCLATAEISYLFSILGFGLVGLGTANIAPQCISYVATMRGIPQNLSVFAVNGIGAVGSLFGPVLIGQAAAWLSLKVTFMLIAALLLTSGILSAVCLHSSQSNLTPVPSYLKLAKFYLTIAKNTLKTLRSPFRAKPLEALDAFRTLKANKAVTIKSTAYKTSLNANLYVLCAATRSRSVLYSSLHSSLLLSTYQTPFSFESLPERFALLENPWLVWQTLALQHWVLSCEEPPGNLKC